MAREPKVAGDLHPVPEMLDSTGPEWEPFHMTRGAQSLLDAFEQLPPVERAEVVRELLRRTASSVHESPSDEELLQAADGVFLGLDQREA